MNMISTLRRRVIDSCGKATITAEEFDQLQAEWITRVGLGHNTGNKPDLEQRMQEAGMIPLAEMLSKSPLGPFGVHTGVVDIASFEQWLKMRYEEMLRARLQLELDKDTKDEMFEWYFSHAAAFGEALANFRAATARAKPE